MGMKVNIHKQVFQRLSMVNDQLLDSKDGGMFAKLGLLVKPIQVEALRVEPVVASTNAVRVQKWNYLENEVLSQPAGLLTLHIR